MHHALLKPTFLNVTQKYLEEEKLQTINGASSALLFGLDT